MIKCFLIENDGIVLSMIYHLINMRMNWTNWKSTVQFYKKKNNKEIVKSIPYMFTDKCLICPCSFKFKDHFFHCLQNSSSNISNCDTVFNSIDDLLRHLNN